jgi:hypothetical protein
VVHALRNIHQCLVTGGRLIDTQPVSPQPPVDTDGDALGTLDMSEWARTIDQIDRLTAQTLRAGLFTIVAERRFTVSDQFDSGAELVAETRQWAGTHVDPALAGLIADQQRAVRLHQEVRLRVLQTQRQGLRSHETV